MDEPQESPQSLGFAAVEFQEVEIDEETLAVVVRRRRGSFA